MRITVTFADGGDTGIPDGTLVFENADEFQLSTPADIENASCADVGCGGCSAVHRRFTGRAHLRLEASGGNRARWVTPEGAVVT